MSELHLHQDHWPDPDEAIAEAVRRSAAVQKAAALTCTTENYALEARTSLIMMPKSRADSSRTPGALASWRGQRDGRNWRVILHDRDALGLDASPKRTREPK